MKTTLISILVTIVLVGGMIMLNREPTDENASASNVTLVDEQQVIEIEAKGGYTPRTTVAQAGIPTVIKFKTTGTFDCSSAIRIPSLDISKNLQPNSTTEVALGTPEAGVLQGTCGMGMYPFEIEFKA